MQQSCAEEYQLCQSFVTDGEPVRTITTCHPPKSNDPESEVILSGSESGVLATITLSSSSSLSSEDTTPSSSSDPIIVIQPNGQSSKHPHTITSILSIPDTKFYITGCRDSIIRVWDSLTHELMFQLSGHEKSVTSLSFFTIHGTVYLLSGSWDGTAKIWSLETKACCYTIPDHENTVSVVALPTTSDSPKAQIVTGSAGYAQGNDIINHSIRIFDVIFDSTTKSLLVSMVHKIVQDHSGPIRSLSYHPIMGYILSCSNDGTVKIRNPEDGVCVTTLSAISPQSKNHHPPMLLDVTSLSNGKIVACGEDGSIFIWTLKDDLSSTNLQVIEHPNCVWKISPLLNSSNNGDFLTACHDGTIRRFTLDPNRIASESDRKAFQESVIESKAKSSSGPTAEEIQSLPKWESSISHVGKSEGQVQVFQKNGKAIAAQWSSTSRTWIEVGEVTGRNENVGMIDGVKYDHVLPIEVDIPGGGVQKLKIGYNNGENPFVAAQKFIDDHMLDQNYLAQIADYIRSRVGESSVTLGTGSNGQNGSTAHSSMMDIESTVTDYTMEPVSTPTYKYLPMKGYKTFENGIDKSSLSKMKEKIREFNSSFTNNLPQDEITNTLDEIGDILIATSRYHATTFNMKQLSIVEKMINSWTLLHVFPALDLARILVLHPDASRFDRVGYWNSILNGALDKCQQMSTSDVQGTPSVAIPMLTFRLVANCFRGGGGSLGAVSSQFEKILRLCQTFVSSENKNIRLSIATVLLNISSYLYTHKPNVDTILQNFLSTVGDVVGCGKYETEAMIRVLVSVGTLILIDDTFKEKAKLLQMRSMIQNAVGGHGDKAADIASEILHILS